MTDNRMLVPVSNLAKLFGLTERRVQQLAADGIIPKAERGKYHFLEAVKGYIHFLQGRAFGKGGDAVDSHTEKTRWLKHKATLAEIEVDEKRGELISAAAVYRQDAKTMRIFTNNLQSLPDRQAAVLAAETDPKKIHRILAAECDRLQAGVIAGLHAEVDDDELDITRADAHEQLAGAGE